MSIVTVNVSQTVAPAPSQLQKKGAFVSQGATDRQTGTITLLRSKAELAPYLKTALAIATLAWNANVVTATTAAPHGLTNGQVIGITIAGAAPAGYNGTYAATVTGASTFTYALVANPGAMVTPGTYILSGVSELAQMNDTFFNQGSQQSVYILELGPNGTAAGITALETWLDDNPLQIYAFLVPRAWASDATYDDFLGNYNTEISRVYFFTTATLENYANFNSTMKCAFVLVESPDKPATEFTCAAPFYHLLNYRPSSTNRVTPFAYSYMYDVTQYPLFGNSADLGDLEEASTNYIGTGAEGGISNNILRNGTLRDGRDVTYWYSIDWVQIEVGRAIAAAVINGSNNPVNPLLYNQDGINRLQAVAAGVMASGVSFGLVLFPPVQTSYLAQALQDALNSGELNGQTDVNAIPFIPYSQENPTHYGQGKYEGFTIVYTPARGFISIVFNVNVTEFVTA